MGYFDLNKINLSSTDNPDELWESGQVVTPPLQGNMYEVRLVWVDGKARIIKRLRNSIIHEKSYYSSMSLDRIFETHKTEHELFQNYLPQFTLPTEFFVTDNSFLTLQSYVQPGFQYKLALRDSIGLPAQQLPPAEEISAFMDGIDTVMNISGKIPDLDFFITRLPEDVNNRIVVFDTSGFWHDKREGKDKLWLQIRLSKFFSRES